MSTALEFRILGPLEVVGTSPVFIRARKQRILLASLLLRANQVVPTERLIEELWAGDGPADARRTLQVHVARLRRALEDGYAGHVIRTLPDGYLIEVSPECLDLIRFQDLITRSRSVRQQNDLEGEATLLAEALLLWRGPALDDIQSDTLRDNHVPRLTEQWLTALERRFELELMLGRHNGIIGELRVAVGNHPLRETLWCQLMVALYRSGRQAEALQTFRTVSGILATELGLDPGVGLTSLHQAILSGAPELLDSSANTQDTGAASPPAPEPLPPKPDWRVLCQLPGVIGDFVGRTELLDRVVHMTTPADHSGSVPIVALCGPPGVGKSALALCAAWRLRAAYPDGQWYAKVVTPAGARRDPAEVLGELLRASGVEPATIPETTEARAAMFRARLTDRKVLLLLDDVRDADDVVPMLPGSPGCAVLITSRTQLPRLVALHGARVVSVPALRETEAIGLLRQMLGADTIAVQPGATAELARLCGFLPLALRVAAANLAGRPARELRNYVAELGRGDRLSKLAIGRGEPEVRATFDLSYLALNPRARRLFRAMGVVPRIDFTPETIAVLAGGPTRDRDSEADLRELVAAHMVEIDERGRYRLHELLGLYAADRAAAEETDAWRQDRRVQLMDWYLHSAYAAMREHRPGLATLPPPAGTAVRSFVNPRGALAWLDAERANLIAIIQDAAEHGPRHVSWHLADILRGDFWSGRHYDAWLIAARAGERAAAAEHDPVGLNAMRFSIGLAYRCLGNVVQAERHLRSALIGFRDIGQTSYEVAALGERGVLAAQSGELNHGMVMLARSRDKAHEHGLAHAEARTLRNLGTIHHALGRLDDARDHLVRALKIDRELGVRHALPEGRRKLGLVLGDMGKQAAAIEHLNAGLAVSSQVGARYEQALCHCGLVAAHDRPGARPLAVRHGELALALGIELADPVVQANALCALAGVTARGDPPGALERYETALDLCRTLVQRQLEVEVLAGLAHCHRLAGNVDAALACARRCLDDARRCGLRLVEGRAEAELAAIHLECGDRESALRHARLAVGIQQETRHHAELPATLRLFRLVSDSSDTPRLSPEPCLPGRS